MRSNDLEETIASRVVEPRVVVWTTDARLQVDGFAGDLFARQLAGVGHPARGLAFHHTLLSPRLEVLRLGHGARVLDPLDDLRHRHEVHVVVVGEDLVDPVKEGFQEFGVVL